MKNHLLVFATIISSFLTINCNRCNGGIDCYNPDTTKEHFPNFAKNWFPYKATDTIILSDSNSNEYIFKVNEISLKEVGYFQGDECPNKPGEALYGTIIHNTDSLFINTDETRNLTIDFSNLKFGISAYKGYRNAYSLNKFTTVVFKENFTFNNEPFDFVIIAQSDSIETRKLYLANGYGIIGIQKNDNLYKLKF